MPNIIDDCVYGEDNECEYIVNAVKKLEEEIKNNTKKFTTYFNRAEKWKQENAKLKAEIARHLDQLVKRDTDIDVLRGKYQSSRQEIARLQLEQTTATLGLAATLDKLESIKAVVDEWWDVNHVVPTSAHWSIETLEDYLLKIKALLETEVSR